MKNIILTAIMLLLSNLVFSQQYEIHGKIINDKGRPVSGAVIHTTPGNLDALSTQKGAFKITGLVRGNYKIVVSYVGYEIEEYNILVPNKSPLIVTLKPGVEHLQEVIVEDHHASERRREESQNIEIVNNQFIEQNMGGSLMQSLGRLPGVSSMDIGAGISKPVLRGLSFNRVVVAENGIKHEAQQWGADHGLEINQHNISEVGVIKGAASLMYGSDAIGGVVNLKSITVPMKNSFGGNLMLNAQSINDQIGSSLNLYARKTKTYFTTNASWSDYADYKVPTSVVNIYSYPAQLNNNRMRNTAGQEGGVNLTVGYKTDSLHSNIHLSSYFSKVGFFANAHGLEPINVDRHLHDADKRDIQLPFQEVRHIKANYHITKTGKNHLLKFDLGWQHNLREERGPYVNHGYMPDSLPDSLGIAETLERKFSKHTISANLSNQYEINNHSIHTGIQLSFQKNEIGGWNFIIPEFTQIQAGAFIYDKWKLNDEFLLHTGLRLDMGSIKTREYYDWYESRIVNHATNDTTYQKLQRTVDLNKTFSNLSFAAGMNYNLKHFEGKAHLGKSFRMPIPKELAANGVNFHTFSYDIGNQNLHPEESYQLDVSGEFHYPLWAIQLSPFVNYFPNYIYLNPTPFFDFDHGAGNQIFEYRESEVIRFGGEIHGHYKFVESLKLGVIAEYVFSEQLSGEKKGYTLPFSPPPTLLFSLKYTPDFTDKFMGTYFSVDYKLTGKQSRIVPPEFETEGYSLVNLSIGTKLKWNQQWVHFTFRVNNLFDKKYLNHTSYYRLIGIPEPGINFSASVKIPFTF
jgi:iron complex outermembrane receptor protein